MHNICETECYGLISLKNSQKSKKKTTITLSTTREVYFSKMLSNCEVSTWFKIPDNSQQLSLKDKNGTCMPIKYVAMSLSPQTSHKCEDLS